MVKNTLFSLLVMLLVFCGLKAQTVNIKHYSNLLAIYIETSEQLTFMVDVYSVGGHKVKTFRADENSSVADLSSGGYIVKWKCGAKTRSVKFMK